MSGARGAVDGERARASAAGGSHSLLFGSYHFNTGAPGPECDHLVWLHSDIGISILVQSTRNSLACYSCSEPVDIYVCQKPRACIVLRAICSYSYCTSSSVMRVRT